MTLSNSEVPRWRVITDGAVANSGFRSSGRVLELPRSPNGLEDELRSGEWVVLVAAVWSEYDHNAIRTAEVLSLRVPPGVNVAIRRFDEYDEFGSWCSGVDVKEEFGGSTPIWLFLRDGRVDRFYVGPYLGANGENAMWQRVDGWLKGLPKVEPPTMLSQIVNLIRSFGFRRS